MTLLQQTNQLILAQLSDLLHALSHEAYTHPLGLLHHSSVGQHIRHTLEFYQCLFEQAPLGFVDYDVRNRDLRLETDLNFSIAFVEQLTQQFNQTAEDKVLSIEVLIGSQSQRIQTTLMRELLYMTEHAVHHFAIIKIALNEAFPTIQLPAHFGVAFSTIKYRESIGA
jgi:uncharacterized damage-inducible protein DinB